MDKKPFSKEWLLVAFVVMGLLTIVLLLASRIDGVEITEFVCVSSGQYRGMVAITYEHTFQGATRKHGPVTFWPQWGDIHTTAEMDRYHVWVNVFRQWPKDDTWIALVRLKDAKGKLLKFDVAEVICRSDGPDVH